MEASLVNVALSFALVGRWVLQLFLYNHLDALDFLLEVFDFSLV
jgi:hypothetical protein